MMGAIGRGHSVHLAISVAMIALLAGSAGAAGRSRAGASAPSFSCDSTSRICKCTSWFDCEAMKDKVCSDGTFDCAADGKSCTCGWKTPSKGPAGGQTTPQLPKAPMLEAR